jgi:acyl-CoA thioesterase
MSHSLRAALRTIGDADDNHSLHCSNADPSNVKSSILYQVECKKDGKTFASRFIKCQEGDEILPLFDWASRRFQVPLVRL